MKNSKKKFLAWNQIIASQVAVRVWIALLTGASAFAADDAVQNSGPANNPVMQIFDACTTTLTNIQHELQKLGTRFPALDRAASAKIASARPAGTGNSSNPIRHRLEYRKNVRIETVLPDAQGRVPASNERHIVEKDGVELEIYIVDRPIKVGGSVFLLPMGTGDNQMRLVLHLEENPSDPSLEKAISDIVAKNLEALSQSLRKIQM